jgi:hypothetical protein
MMKKKLIKKIKNLELFIEQLQREHKSDFGLVLKYQQLQSDYIKLERTSTMHQQNAARAIDEVRCFVAKINEIRIEKNKLE